MDMSIRPLRAEEQKYTFAKSQQLNAQTGAIGHLRGDFGSTDTGFYTTWFDENEARKSDAFKAELDDVINALRFNESYGGLLKSRSAMLQYCTAYPDSIFEEKYSAKYGFRIDTGNFVYLLRCNPVKGDYNFYCWCFQNPAFDRHLQNARKGIRFITPSYKEIFRIPDGDYIYIIGPDGAKSDKRCRYIDDCHFEFGGIWNDLFHICQFAEMMERNGCTAIPLRSSLPEQCYGVLAETGEIVIYKKGETGYYKTDIFTTGKEESLEIAEEHNALAGISKAQAAAMQIGSMCGWHTPGADPAYYDENGQPIKPKHLARDDAR